MDIKHSAVSLCVLAALVGSAVSAEAHGMIGQRFLPATLATDDPFVADELSLPTIFHIKLPSAEDTPATKFTSLSSEFSKRLSPNLGISATGAWDILAPDGGNTFTGFENMEVNLKYVYFTDVAHELMLSAGFTAAVGGTGRPHGAGSFRPYLPP